jgi:hypothetical protein
VLGPPKEDRTSGTSFPRGKLLLQLSCPRRRRKLMAPCLPPPQSAGGSQVRPHHYTQCSDTEAARWCVLHHGCRDRGLDKVHPCQFQPLGIDVTISPPGGLSCISLRACHSRAWRLLFVLSTTTDVKLFPVPPYSLT